jgi:hypothetical protein
MENTEILKEIIEAQKEYIKILSDELNELTPLAYVRGWRTTRYEMGKAVREKISQLESKIS